MLALSFASLAQWPRFFPGAFSAAECDAIAQLFLESSATAEIDERTSEGVNRVNRWDTDNRLRDSGRLDGVYARVASSLGVDLDVKGMTEFTLMHEEMSGLGIGTEYRGLSPFPAWSRYDKKRQFNEVDHNRAQ